MKKELLRLFKGYKGAKIVNSFDVEAMHYGILIPSSAPKDVIKEAISMYGIDGQLWNQTFHKSWDKVAHAPLLQLLVEQLVHYITTYGFERLGCYSEDTVFIPTEKLEVPDIDVKQISFTVIKCLSDEDITSKLMDLVTSGIALSEQTISDIKVLSDYIDKERFDEVANREVRTFLYDKYNIMPKNPDAFLRYLIFKTTNATLKIKNVPSCKALKASNKDVVLSMLNSYGELSKLAQNFLRDKRLFLALKTPGAKKGSAAAEVNTIINRIRKLAKIYHKPLNAKLLDSLTNPKVNVSKTKLYEALDNATLFRAISILNMLAFRINGGEDIVYRVRNGKSYVSKTEHTHVARLEKIYKYVREYIVDHLKTKVNAKYVYIPSNVVYKAPATEKQFIGNVPDGSYIEIPEQDGLVIAVHWKNLPRERVDLDFHLMNKNESFGWCYDWRNNSILFSGDITDAPAPKGATEAYHIKTKGQAYLATLNWYNHDYYEEKVCPFEFMIATDKKNKLTERCRNYTVNPNEIISKFNMKITSGDPQITIGLIKENRFYFGSYGLDGKHRITVRNDYTVGAFNYFSSYSDLQVTLNDLLMEAGAIVVNTPTVEEMDEVEGVVEVPVDIDLSIENIDKTTIIKLLTK